MLLWVRAYYHWNRNEAKMSIYLLSPKTHLLTKPDSRRIVHPVANSQSKVEMFVLCLPVQVTKHTLFVSRHYSSCMLLLCFGESGCFKLVRFSTSPMFLCSCHLSNHSVELHGTHLYLQKKLKPREVKGLSQSYNEPKTKRTGSYDRKGWILE